MIKEKKSKFTRLVEMWIWRKLGPSKIYAIDGFAYWRERVFHYFTLALVTLGLFLYLYYFVSYLQKWHLEYAMFITIAFVSVFVITVMKVMSFRFRVNWMLLLVYIVGGFIYFLKGFESIGLVVLLSFSLLSAILKGGRESLMSLIMNMTLLVVYDILHYTTWLSDQYILSENYLEHVQKEVLFVIVNVVTLLPLISFMRGINYALTKERRFMQILSEEREKLMRASLKAEESDVLKTAFLSNMSHEIRTPMNAILGFANLLSHKEISAEEKEEFVNLIRINGKNLLTLVEDIIDISKIDSGQLQVKNSPFCLHDLLSEVYDSFWDDIRRRGQLNIKLYLNEGISDINTIVLADATRLKQIVVNLVGNAIKFTERGFVEFGYEKLNEETLQFYVKDTGIGLPKGKEKEVFKRFSKFNDDKCRLYGGTGIGLSIAEDLVNLMGGKIWVESEYKVGTTFYFTLPFHRVTGQVKREEELNDGVEYNWEGKTFLVAEDEEDNFRYLEVALSISNASLIWARNGMEAVEIFTKINNIDLVLMDVKMPEMDGYAATREIKQVAKGVPVIAQTAYAMSEEREKSALAGCDDYIAKPINYTDLLRVIHKYVPGK